MKRCCRRRAELSLVLIAALAAAPVEAAAKTASPPPPPGPTTDTLNGLEFRGIGPAIMGGRVDDLAVVERRPSTFYVATASGGVFKTLNNGVTFEPVFDDQTVSSVGDIALAPSDPSILYLGSGEPNNRQSSSWGNGVYKTNDGGKSWKHLGLADTHHIARIVVHPHNPDVAYVAALGHLWGPNKERGLFKTSDGGASWTNTRFIDEDTGFVDVAMDAESPDTLYAAAYQRRRTPFGFNGGGPGGGLWKTTDGGRTWTKLAKGLPEGELGRIGVTVYRKDPRIVYALIEHAKEGGVYRSEDKGESWSKQSGTNPRPSYYSKIHVDPTNDQRVWVLGAPMYYSEDGGKTFKNDLVQKIHGDHHALWIDPADPNHMILGTDGGIHLSYDRGRTWDFANSVPLAQFYEIAVDMRKPYWVYGGLQDNGSWMGPSRTLYQQGIGNEDWVRVGGGDGFYVQVDPSDHTVLYVESQDGNVQRLHTDRFERRVIRPEPPEGERYRFNWNSPILISAHDPRTIYYGGNRLFGSKDRGDTWTLVTPDLTSGAERDKLTIFGKTAKEMLSRNDGVVHFGSITTIAESLPAAGVLWVGTDDGNLHISRDAGASWTSIASRVPGVPKGTYVSRVVASRTSEGAAYVAFDGHRGNDFRPYLFRSEDFGQTWRSLAGNLPMGATLSVVREHPKNPDLLFAGTESGLWVSWNRGGAWHKATSKLPTVPVDDLLVHPAEGDLVIGTHGRGVYILDDAAPLAALGASVLASDLHLFDMRRATQYRVYNHKANTGHKAFLAANPPDGALITYYLKSAPGEKDDVKIVVKDASDALIRTLEAPKEKRAGLNRVSWDLRHEPPVPPDPERPAFLGPPRGPFVPPGAYTVTVSVGSFSASRPVEVEEDPRIRLGDAERRLWYDQARAAAKLWTRADAANRATTSFKKQLGELQEALKKDARATPALNEAVKALADKVEALAKRASRQDPLGFAGAPLAEDPEPLLNQARGLYQATGSLTAPLTPQQSAALARVERQLGALAAEVNAVVEGDLPALNKLLLEGGLGKLDPGKRVE